MRYLKVKIRGKDKVLETTPDPARNLRQLLMKHKLSPYKGIFKLANCHGKGLCGACSVRVVDNPGGLTDKTEVEAKKLWAASPQTRLSCQAWVCGDIEIDLDKITVASEEEMREEAVDAREAIAAAKAAAE